MTNDLDNLEARLARFRATEKTEKDIEAEQAREAENMSLGMRAGTELIACLIGGVVIGWFLDKWLGTLPLFLIIFTLSGIGAGFMNVYRITQNMGSASGSKALQNAEKQGKKTTEKDA